MHVNRIRKTHLWLCLGLSLVILGFAGSVLRDHTFYIDQPFAGYVAFDNGVIGPFFMPTWTGYTQGKVYHQEVEAIVPLDEVFTQTDYVGVVMVPVLTGVLFFLMGLGLFLYSPIGTGRHWLLVLHFFAGMYLVLSPDLQMGHRFSCLLLFCFSMIPASAIAMAQDYPYATSSRPRWSRVWPWGVSALFAIANIVFFTQPATWMIIEQSLMVYLVFAYGYWLRKQWLDLQKPKGDFSRIMARYELKGQVVAFMVPLMAAMAIFIWDIPVPLNLIAPVILLFPAVFFIGMLLSKIKQNQMQIVHVDRQATMGTLTAGLAHEMNNPLNFIHAALEPLQEKIQAYIQDPAHKQDVQELVDVIQEGADRAKQMVTQLQHFSAPQPVTSTQHRLVDILHAAKSMLTTSWPWHITYGQEVDESLTVWGRGLELEQVMVNLLQNAVQAMTQAGSITVSARQDANQIHIRIVDTGPGMPSDVMDRIFDPFFTTKSQGQGTGLGLTIAMRIVQDHQGRLLVESQPEKGTAFHITLPATS